MHTRMTPAAALDAVWKSAGKTCGVLLDQTALIASVRIPTFQLETSKLACSASIRPLPAMQRLSIPYFYRIGEILTHGL